MQCNGTDDVTEQQFMQALWNRVSACCGPVVRLKLRSPGLDDLLAALDSFGASEVITRAEQRDGSYAMCAAHWYDVSILLGGAGDAKKNARWRALKSALFISVSREAGWDSREMFNRFASYIRAKTGGYDFLGV